MDLDHDACYRAIAVRDARFDGRLFTGVKTTGIYCRPICPARPPKIQNCTFVPTAAAAQEAGRLDQEIVLPPRVHSPEYHRGPIPREMYVPAIY